MDKFTALMIRASGRSWWQARYLDGRVLNEWDTMTTSLPGSSRWEDIPKKNMIGLRLLCPNWRAGELEAPEDHKFFQLKVGYFDVRMFGGGSSRTIGAHLIGVVEDDTGKCQCYAWDYSKKELLHFYDNVFAMQYENIGKLSLGVQELKV